MKHPRLDEASSNLSFEVLLLHCDPLQQSFEFFK